MSKVGVIGSRDFDDYDLMVRILDEHDIKMIVSGGARGADRLAEQYAEEKNLAIKIYIPKWYSMGEYDKTAGFKRNLDIIKESDYIIAFWDGESKGTAHSIREAKRVGKEVYIIKYKEISIL